MQRQNMEIVRSRDGVPIRLTEERRVACHRRALRNGGPPLTPQLLNMPYKRIWYSYDEGADVLYLNLKPSHADDSELTDEDIILRYEEGELVGVTILHASKRINAI